MSTDAGTYFRFGSCFCRLRNARSWFTSSATSFSFALSAWSAAYFFWRSSYLACNEAGSFGVASFDLKIWVTGISKPWTPLRTGSSAWRLSSAMNVKLVTTNNVTSKMT